MVQKLVCICCFQKPARKKSWNQKWLSVFGLSNALRSYVASSITFAFVLWSCTLNHAAWLSITYIRRVGIHGVKIAHSSLFCVHHRSIFGTAFQTGKRHLERQMYQKYCIVHLNSIENRKKKHVAKYYPWRHIPATHVKCSAKMTRDH